VGSSTTIGKTTNFYVATSNTVGTTTRFYGADGRSIGSASTPSELAELPPSTSATAKPARALPSSSRDYPESVRF
jgi:hypothetical protein